jgi:hypothetical protein
MADTNFIPTLNLMFLLRRENYRLMPTHEIARTIGPERAVALPAFNAFTGCDTTSSFLGRGKKKLLGRPGNYFQMLQVCSNAFLIQMYVLQ